MKNIGSLQFMKRPAREHAAAVQLLYQSPNLPRGAFMKLVSDLQAIRKDCNELMLAVRARHNKMLDLLMFTCRG